ncbi:MAG: hypothetical protein AAF442_00020 [Pseudomonadota bacterium]
MDIKTPRPQGLRSPNKGIKKQIGDVAGRVRLPSAYINAGIEHGPLAGIGGAVADVGAALLKQHKAEERRTWAAYEARVKMDNSVAIQEAALRHSDDPEGYTKSIKMLRDKTMPEIAQERREEFGLFFDGVAAQHGLNIQATQYQKIRDEENADLKRGADTLEGKLLNAAFNGDEETVHGIASEYQALIEARTDYTPQQKEEMLIQLEQKHKIYAARGQWKREVDANGLDAGRDLIESIRNDKAIPIEMRDTVVGALKADQRDYEARTTREQAEIDAQQREWKAEIHSNFQHAIANGDGTHEINEALFAQGITNGTQYAANKKAIDKGNEQRLQDMHDRTFVAGVISGDIVPDWDNKDHQRAVDKNHERVLMPRIQALPPEQQTTALAKGILDGGILPSQIKAPFRTARSHKPEIQAELIDLYAWLKRSGSPILDQLKEGERKYIELAVDIVEDGVPYLQAIEQATELTDPSKQEQRAYLQEKLKEEDPITESDITQYLDGWHYLEANVPPHIIGQILGDVNDARAREFHFVNGDSKLAKKRALRLITRTYGMSEITGKKLVMQHPPDAFYAKQPGDGKLMYQALVDTVESTGQFGRAHEFKDRLVIQSDPITARGIGAWQAGTGKKEDISWAIAVEVDGHLESVLNPDGTVMRARPGSFHLDAARKERDALMAAELPPESMASRRGLDTRQGGAATLPEWTASSNVKNANLGSSRGER